MQDKRIMSVYICQSYRKSKSGTFFWTTVYYREPLLLNMRHHGLWQKRYTFCFPNWLICRWHGAWAYHIILKNKNCYSSRLHAVDTWRLSRRWVLQRRQSQWMFVETELASRRCERTKWQSHVISLAARLTLCFFRLTYDRIPLPFGSHLYSDKQRLRETSGGARILEQAAPAAGPKVL